MRRAALLWLALFAVYAATVGLDATAGGANYAPAEARLLLGAESIVSDGDVDRRDEYRERKYADWVDGPLRPVAGLTEGRLHEPPGVGLPLLIAPAYALAGPVGAELLVAALLALGFVAAAALARRLVPDPWATSATLVAGLSAPALGWATAIRPEPVAAAAVAGAALAALRVRDAPRLRPALTAALLIAILPWLSVKFLPLAAVCAIALARWLRRRRQGLAAFVALEVVLFAGVALITVNEQLYGGLSPYEAVLGEPTGASTVAEYAERAARLATLWVDPDAGLLVWAPFAALAFLSLALLARSLRERLAVALPGVVDIEVTAGFLAALCAVQVLVAAFVAPTLAGGSFAAKELIPIVPVGAALCGWALRHAPRAGAALAALTLVASAWLLVAARIDDDARLAPPGGALPWQGAEPAIAAVALVTLAVLLVREWRDWSESRPVP